MDCLQLPFIRVEKAVSWTRVSWQEKLVYLFIYEKKFIYDKQIWKQMFAEILRFK